MVDVVDIAQRFCVPIAFFCFSLPSLGGNPQVYSVGRSAHSDMLCERREESHCKTVIFGG